MPRRDTDILRATARTLYEAKQARPNGSRLEIRRLAAKLAGSQAVMGRTVASRRIGQAAFERHNAIAHDMARLLEVRR